MEHSLMEMTEFLEIVEADAAGMEKHTSGKVLDGGIFGALQGEDVKADKVLKQKMCKEIASHGAALPKASGFKAGSRANSAREKEFKKNPVKAMTAGEDKKIGSLKSKQKQAVKHISSSLKKVESLEKEFKKKYESQMKKMGAVKTLGGKFVASDPAAAAAGMVEAYNGKISEFKSIKKSLGKKLQNVNKKFTKQVTVLTEVKVDKMTALLSDAKVGSERFENQMK